jgi:hypothetical protein
VLISFELALLDSLMAEEGSKPSYEMMATQSEI